MIILKYPAFSFKRLKNVQFRKAFFNHVPNSMDLDPVSSRNDKPLDPPQEIFFQPSAL